MTTPWNDRATDQDYLAAARDAPRPIRECTCAHLWYSHRYHGKGLRCMVEGCPCVNYQEKRKE